MEKNRTYADRAAYLIAAVKRRRKNLKQISVDYKGGKCKLCGYDRCIEALDFHHIGKGKDFGLSSRGITRAWTKVRRELDKCILVCANCHREIHAGSRQLSTAMSKRKTERNR